MSMDTDGNGKKSTTFRWINVARYVVATVITVLIATVVVIAVKTVMRPESLNVEVVGGAIYLKSPPGSPPNQLQLVFTVDTKNPSGRAVMYFYNITCYLFDKNISASTLHPQADCIVSLCISNQTLQQQESLLTPSQGPVGPAVMTPSYFDMLYNNRSARIEDVTMRMEGYLVTEPFSGHNTTARWTTYYCSSLVVGWAPATTRDAQDNDEANKNTQGSRLCTVVGGP